MKRIFSIISMLAVFQTGDCCVAFGKTCDTNRINRENAALTISAGVYYGDEDEERVPVSVVFYLLNKNIVDLLKREDFEPIDENDKPLVEETAYLEALASAFAAEDEANLLVAALIEDIIAKNKIALVQTDRRGQGKLKTIESGDYYLFGYKQIDDEIFVWNLPARLVGGQTRIEIDQHNANAVINVR